MAVAESSILRRTISISAALLGLPLWLALSPVWLIVSVLVDGVSRLWRFPSLRLCAFLAVYLVHDWIGIFSATWLWLTGGFGRRMNLNAHRRVQAWWATSLLTWGGRLLGVKLDLGDPSDIPSGDLIVLSRHASMADAIVPASLIADQLDRYVHYALKRELRWAPSLDLFGTRLRNHFVARGNDTKVEQNALHQMAVEAEPNSALVIFPEGTYATAQTRERVLRSLRRIGDEEIIARAEKLTSLLPPKPAGTQALFRGRPNADVLVIGHVGLEGVAELRGLRQRLPLTKPVIVRWWVHLRSELPDTESSLAEWLADRWQELDDWVVSFPERPGGRGS